MSPCGVISCLYPGTELERIVRSINAGQPMRRPKSVCRRISCALGTYVRCICVIFYGGT